MTKRISTTSFYLTLLTGLSSCSVVGAIFKTGMGVGIIIMVVVLALILFFTTRSGK